LLDSLLQEIFIIIIPKWDRRDEIEAEAVKVDVKEAEVETGKVAVIAEIEIMTDMTEREKETHDETAGVEKMKMKDKLKTR